MRSGDLAILKNPKHEAFVQARASGKSAVEAYCEVGFRGNRSAAARLARTFAVRTRIAELQRSDLQQAEDRRARLIADVEAIAFDEENNGAHIRLRALELLMRLEGMLSGGDKTIVVNNNVALIDKPPDESLEEWTARRCRELGVTPAEVSKRGRKRASSAS